MNTQTQFLTPPKVAALLGITHLKVIHWIALGHLDAVDLSTNKNQRPRWYISRANLDLFLERRASKPTSTPKPKRRRKRKADTITEFYKE